ncbi:MAG: glycosyl transferase, family 2, partial [Bryobacterales bacterium]|nr:glycosyl transferase, family 2 [Bryobacterales bacterium]
MIYPQRGIGNTLRAVLGAAARFIRVNPLEWLSYMRPSFLSVLIPLYNEEEFIRPLLERVLHAPYPEGVEFEIIVVNDCSTDGSSEAVQDFMRTHPAPIRLVHHEHNQGKGAAIRTAIQLARGEFCLIQDADLEYDPQEYPKLLAPLLAGKADAVYGSRFLVAGERRVLYFWHSLANHILTLVCNIAADLNLTDMETCYKVFRTSLVRTIPIRSNRFGIEPELTIKLARRQARIYETPISYHGRTYEEGKKIGLSDAFEAFWVMLKYRFTNDLYNDAGLEILDALSFAPKFNEWMADTIAPYLGSRVLEIGAGTGNLTRPLAHRRQYYAATDIGREQLEALRNRFAHRPNLEVRQCDVENPEEVAYFQGKVDTVVCLNVLEHVAEADRAARNLYSVLEPGGRAIVLVPQGQEIFGTLDVVLGHHLRYSQAQLRERLEKAGFTVERIIEFNRVSRPGWYITGRVLKRSALARFPMRCFNSL